MNETSGILTVAMITKSGTLYHYAEERALSATGLSFEELIPRASADALIAELRAERLELLKVQDDWMIQENTIRELRTEIAGLRAKVPDAQWITDLKAELLHSKMTHSFHLSRDELIDIFGGTFVLLAAAPPAPTP